MQKKYIDNFEKWKQEFTFFVPIKMRFSETDMNGHMNNTVPFIYFEQARIEYMKHLGLMENWFGEGAQSMAVVADMQCDYVKPVYLEEELRVFVKIATIGKSSVDMHYLGMNEKDEICFTGRGNLVQVNPKTGKSLPWKEEQLAHVPIEIIK
ncbi:acyl-CoA thioesterase [Rummeliibacillus sp. JY-2-4R]